MQIMFFCTFEIALFSIFRVLCQSWDSKLVTDRGYPKSNFRVVPGISQKIEQGLFLHFFSKFWHIWWFFNMGSCQRSAVKLWKIFKYVQKKLSANEEKPCSTGFKPLFQLISVTRKSDFGYPIRRYILKITQFEI